MKIPALKATKILVSGLVLIFATDHYAYADDQDVITYRQMIMKELDAEAGALGMIVSGQIPPDSLSLQTRAIVISAKSALKAFESKVPGGGSRPEVWSKWDDFSRRIQSFGQKAEAMAKAGETGNMATVMELIDAAMPCKQCHDVYRVKK